MSVFWSRIWILEGVDRNWLVACHSSSYAGWPGLARASVLVMEALAHLGLEELPWRQAGFFAFTLASLLSVFWLALRTLQPAVHSCTHVAQDQDHSHFLMYSSRRVAV
ncbi:hypothetical protein K439DRAFT_816480 [Ramaria rubella]|nr:hypothetical protein K439DRAFT_816480 [Ramaria rubella]